MARLRARATGSFSHRVRYAGARGQLTARRRIPYLH